MSKSKYRIYRPMGRKVPLATIIFTFIAWVLFAIWDVAVVTWRVIRYDLTYIYNLIHYRKLEYSPKEIENMIREMNPREFEVFVSELYRRMGYDIELTQAMHDGGKDVIMNDYENDERIYVECKHFSENNYVGREICQKLLGAMAMDNIDRGIIVNTGKFHKNAWGVYHKVDNLEFVGMDDLIEMVMDLDENVVPKVFMKPLQPYV